MKKNFIVRRNKDGTVTFRSGKYVEHIEVETKGMMQTYEAIKYAAITAGMPLTEETLQELFLIARGLKE